MTPSTLSSGSGQWAGRKGFQNSTSDVGLILNGILMWVEGRLLHWHHGMARLAEA